MAEATPVFNINPSQGPNDAAYAARFEETARAEAEANVPAGDFGQVAESPSGSPASAEAPAPLAGKFKDAAELEKAYLELQAKLGAKEPKTEPVVDEAAAAKVIGTEALDGFVSEFRTQGNLSEDSYAKLQSLGLGKAVVDAYIEGQKAVADKQAEGVYAVVGGREGFNEVIDWAGKNLSADDQEAFNVIMGSGNMKSASFAIKTLKAQFDAQNRSPARVEGKATGTQIGFRSKHEMVTAMTDPRYQTDSAFRREVSLRMGASNFQQG